MKSFKEYMIEQTMRVNNFPESYFKDTYDFINDEPKIIGHQDQKAIVYGEQGKFKIYGIMNDDKVTSYMVGEEQTLFGKKYLTTQAIFTDKEHRNKNDMKRLYWFLKSQEGLSLIGFGVQSKDNVEFINSMSKEKRFEFSWLNIKTGDKAQYDADEDPEKFLGTLKPSDWRIIVEGDNEPSFPRWFNKDAHPLERFDGSWLCLFGWEHTIEENEVNK